MASFLAPPGDLTCVDHHRDGPRCGPVSSISGVADDFVLEYGLCEAPQLDDVGLEREYGFAEPPLAPPRPAAAGAEGRAAPSPREDLPATSHDPPAATAAAAAAAPVGALDTPEGFLRMLQSSGYQEGQRRAEALVSGSYRIHHEVPWVLPRPLYLLATAQAPRPGHRQAQQGQGEEGDEEAAPPGLAYTLRTRVDVPGASDDVAQVYRLKNQPAGGRSILTVSRMVDGIIAFEASEKGSGFGNPIGDSLQARCLRVPYPLHPRSLRLVRSPPPPSCSGACRGRQPMLRGRASRQPPVPGHPAPEPYPLLTQDEAAAERFGEQLEAALPGSVHVAQLDSHYLFRMAQDSRGVVVGAEKPGRAGGRSPEIARGIYPPALPAPRLPCPCLASASASTAPCPASALISASSSASTSR